MEWTEENNKATINELLDYYAELLGVYGDFVHANLDAELPTKLKVLQTLKSLATTIDSLLKRWSVAYRGYDGNTHQAREDANAALAERQDGLDGASEVSGSDVRSDVDALELKIVLRELPAMTGNGHRIEGKPLTPTPEPMPMPMPKTPVKKTKAEVVAGIFDQLESGEQTTAAIAASSGRSERSVRRVLSEMVSDGKLSLVKRGVYRLSRSVKWTETDNQTLINALLAVYTALIDACKADVKEIFASQEISETEKIGCVKAFNACVATIDRLMKRWSLVHLGWNTNTGLAKVDAKAKRHHAERVDLVSAPLEAFFHIVSHYDPCMREILENLPPPIKPPDDETGAWSYDATTMELFPPWGSAPIGETEARNRLMKRKRSTPAALILFASTTQA